MGYFTVPSSFSDHNDVTRMIPELLDMMIALGEKARQVSQALGGNGHRALELNEIIKEYSEVMK